MWSKVLFAVLFLVGGFLAATVNLQLSLGVALMIVSWNELRKQGVALDQIDDILKEKIKELLDKE